ncbi:MAG: PAS domain S-box protein [Halobacterium sp.]
MVRSRSTGAPRWARLSWVAVSGLGLASLAVPLYDIWDDVTRLSWRPATSVVENSPLILLSLGLFAAGVWLARQDWEPEYTWRVAKWNVAVAAGIATLYAFIISLQLLAIHSLKPWVLAFDGVLLGSVAAFGIGLNDARHQRARAELEESRERYRTLTNDVLDTSEVATFVLDDDFRVAWTNQAAREYFGLEDGDVVGRDKRALVEDHIAGVVEDSDRLRRRLTATYEDDAGVEEFECRVLPGADREGRWLKHWSKPIETGLYEGGRIEHYTDITAQKTTELELERRERTLREMYDVVSDSERAFDAKVEGVIEIGRELFDAEYGAFSCVDRDRGEYEFEVVQAEDADVESGDVVPLALTHCERTVSEGETLQFETRPFDVEDRDYGTGAGFEMYVGTPVYENENVYGTLCFLDRESGDEFDDWQLTLVELMGNWLGYELNRRRLLDDKEQRIREQEARFEQVVDAVDNYAIFSLDEDGNITSWNRGAERIKGYTESEILGEHIEVFYPEEYLADDLPGQLLAEAEATGQARHEGWRLRRDGTRFWADVTIAARFDANGDHVGYTKVVKDLTEERERERALEHERERLEFMNRIIRHNILNGLNLVNARAELLEGRFDGDPQGRDHLDTIRDRAEDLASMIDTMRAFMDAVVRDTSHELYPVPLVEELEEKVSLVDQSYPDAAVDVHDLPDASTTVVADELVGEVFENVLSNAVVHNDADDPEVEVWTTETTCEVAVDDDTGELSQWAADRHLRGDVETNERPAVAVHVADNGPGIPDDDKERVLEKGVSELSEPGNGFGLYLVTEMMRSYGGRVDVRDNDRVDGDRGTVFDLVFPRPTSDDAA